MSKVSESTPGTRAPLKYQRKLRPEPLAETENETRAPGLARRETGPRRLAGPVAPLLKRTRLPARSNCGFWAKIGVVTSSAIRSKACLMVGPSVPLVLLNLVHALVHLVDGGIGILHPFIQSFAKEFRAVDRSQLDGLRKEIQQFL